MMEFLREACTASAVLAIENHRNLSGTLTV